MQPVTSYSTQRLGFWKPLQLTNGNHTIGQHSVDYVYFELIYVELHCKKNIEMGFQQNISRYTPGYYGRAKINYFKKMVALLEVTLKITKACEQ